jgi:uncharacterized membrane protein
MVDKVKEGKRDGFFKSDRFVLLCLIALGMLWLVVMFLYCSARLASLRYIIIDTGVFESMMWNSLQGNILQSSISHGSFLNFHFSPSLILLVPLYALGQSTEWLFAMQLLAIAAGAPMIFILAKSCGLTRWHGFLLGVVWLFCAPTIGLAAFDVHEVTFTGWLFMLCTWFAIRKKYLPVFILTAVMLGIKEDMAIYLASLGLVLILGFRQTRIGWALIIISLVYFVIIYFFLWNILFPDRLHLEADRFAQFGAQGNILGALLSNPLLMIEPMLRWDRLWAVGMLLIPLSLLPLWHRGMLGVLPSLCVFLSLSVFNWGGFNMHYHAPILALLFIAAIPAMLWLREKLPIVFKISVVAVIPLTIGMHFAIPPEYAYGNYNPASVKPHPSINALKRIFSATSTQSIAADVLAGSAEVRRQQFYMYPCAYLPDIVCSKSAFSMPMTLVLINSLGYRLERPDPVFLILSHTSGRDAGEYYMERLKWIEAEESDAISWDMRSLPGATGGRALYIVNNYGWSDRYLALREEILPAGNYRMGIRLARSGNNATESGITLSIAARGERGGSSNVAVREIKVGEMKEDSLQTYWVDFNIESGAFVHPLLHFDGVGEYWIDGAALDGLDYNFSTYFNSFCKAQFKAGEARMPGGASPKSVAMTPEGKMQLAGVDSEELKLVWDAPAMLEPGMYALFSHIQIESNQHAQIQWAELYAVQNSERTSVIKLYYDNTQYGGSGAQLQLNRVKIPSCDSLELVIDKPADSILVFDQLLFLNLG